MDEFSGLVSKKVQMTNGASIRLALDYEDSSFSVTFDADSLVAAHVSECVDCCHLAGMTFVDENGHEIFRASQNSGGMWSNNTCDWNVYMLAEDVFCKFPASFVGSLYSLVDALKLVVFALNQTK